MVSQDLIQKAIITALKANGVLVAAIGGTDNIKEYGWQGTDFDYPAVRVRVLPQTPIGTGVDHLKLSTVDWSIQVYSEKASSFEASNISGLILDALFNTQIINAPNNQNVPHFTFIRIDMTRFGNPTRLSERLWFCETFFKSQLNLLTSPI